MHKSTSPTPAEAETLEPVAATPPKLTKKTTGGPIANECGSYKWLIRWELDRPTAKGGIVVQKAHAQSAITLCSGKPYTLPTSLFNPAWFPFWEAWEIKKGQRQTAFAKGDDEYKNPVAVTKGSGMFLQTGTAEFFEGVKLSDTSFKVTNKPPAGELPMTTQDPGLTGGSGTVPHNLTATWNCCSGDKTTKIETE